MKYRLSSHDRFLGGALLYRGWGFGGYDLGDKMVFLAGSSLGVKTQHPIVTRVHELVRNVRKFSSYEMGEAEMQQLANLLTSFRPRFVRGYPSALHLFSRWVDQNDVPIPSPEAVFTSAEPLFPHMRKSIGDVFNCEVFNTYGLNDGGVSAYECPEHAGLHIDTERSILEVVDQDNRQLVEGEGTILATSLYNYAMPFIRFSTDDEGTLTDVECACGRHSKLLNEVLGRTADILVTPEGKNIHGWFFNHLFYASGHGIKEYQVTQTAIDQLDIKLVLDESFDETNLETIKESIASKSAGWNVQFRQVEAIDRTRAGKFKFIVNEMAPNVR
jgi:phenylacetate-CoA ligase